MTAISNHPPLPSNEPRRLEALKQLEILDTPEEVEFDRITQHAARLFNVPMAAVSLIDRERQWFKSRVGLHPSETGRSEAFCSWTVFLNDVLMVPDALLDARFSGNPLVTGPLGLRFYAGAPVRTPDGFPIGSLCILDTAPRSPLNDQERAILVDLAAVISDEIGSRIAHRKREEAEAGLDATMRKYESVLDNLQEVVFQADAQGRLTLLNKSWGEITGYSAEATLGKHVIDYVHPDDRERTSQLLEQLHSGVVLSVHDEARLLTDSGEFRWVEVHARAALCDGIVEGTSGTLNDITARKTGEEQLRLAKDEAERANRAKDVFLSRMSHELRTPMNTILGFAQLMEMELEDPVQQESIGRILKAGRHLLGLLNEILDISRIESGHVNLELEAIRPSQAVASALEMMNPLLASRKIRLIHEPHPDEAWVIHADQQRLAQVLLNLISNAIKYNREGGTVTLSYEKRPLDRFRIQVADTGLGIEPDRIEKLFQPFERLGAERSGVEGTGLGLALSKRLVELMDGSIGVESVRGQGSSFWIDLPIYRLAEEHGWPVHSDCVTAAPENVRRVLYIEDDVENVKLVSKILKQRPHFQLITATHGKLGIEMARDVAPDLIVLNLNLLDITGLEVVKHLQQDTRTSGIPVIAVSADSPPSTQRQIIAAGATHYLPKPLDVKEFLSVVDRAAGGAVTSAQI